ncbi:MAG TPA: gamma-glutamyltransferase [Polyangiaceae bacterium]|nr:gamma-glutamyltransferase [Polyangiaceae bacterium]
MRFRSSALLATLFLACGTSRPPVGSSPPPPAPVASVSVPAPALPALPPAWPYVARAPAPSAHGMVASDATLATKVGVDTLAAGGNAADASVALAFALAVVYPMAGNLGGGGFAVTRIGGETRALDFRETAPAAAARDMYASDKTGSQGGYKASGVPGSVAGLYELYSKLGSKKKTWAELMAPAIKLAEEGFVVDEGFGGSFEMVGERLKKFAASTELFFPGGQPLKVGATWKNPDLGSVLRRIADKGPAGFYEGQIADAITADMKANGGYITLADLKGYAPKWRAPLVFEYRGNTVSAMPPPSSGGVTLGMICHILEKYDLASLGWHSPKELHYMFEAMRRSFAARNARLGDPDFVANPVDELLSAKWADGQRATIAEDRATPSSEISGKASSGDGPHTTHFEIVDDAGNAVALTTTINWWYGSGVTIPKTGIVMNNEMDDFASVPGSANGFGLVQGEPNAIAPGKRMLSSMAPTIVTGKDGKVILLAGAAGGPMIITTVFQVLSNIVDHGLDPAFALNAPRFHMQHLPDVVAHEKDGITLDLEKALVGMGYALKERGHIADAMVIGRVPGGWIGAAEPRRKGSLAAGL